MNTFVDHFIIPTSPILSVVLATVLLTILEIISNRPLHQLKLGVASLGLIGGIFLCWNLSSLLQDPSFAFSQAPLADWLVGFQANYHMNKTVLALFAAICLFTLLSISFFSLSFGKDSPLGEIYLITLFISLGMMFLVSSDSLLILFLALELMSLPLYVLVGIRKQDRYSCEAALKYFLFGSFASVLFVLGTTFLYAQFGSFLLPEIAEKMLGVQGEALFSYAAVTLFIVATAFKVGLAPFHLWLPDAYQGAPTVITGFMGSAVKLVGFILITKIFWGLFAPLANQWHTIFEILAVLTMFLGNIMALKQDNLKRMLAYSSVAHAGYLVLALVSPTASGTPMDVLYYYLLVYGVMFIGIFAVIAAIEKATGSTEIYELSGMGFTHPFLGLATALFALSAAGIPPTAGFFAKYFLFLQAVSAGKTWLVICAVLSSLIGVYYYLRILIYLYMKESKRKLVFALPRVATAGLWFCAACLIYFALYPSHAGLGVL